MQLKTPESYNFQEYQRRFAEYCRTNVYPDIPGVGSEDRVSTYRRLVFNLVSDALTIAYPITVATLPAVEWQKLITKFFAEFPCSSPQLWKMPKGLLDFVEQTNFGLDRYPYLRDLLEFEWIEIEVQMMEDVEPDPYQQIIEPLLENFFIVNPEHRVSSLAYPIFRMTSEDLSQFKDNEVLKGNYFLLTFRHPETDKVHYSEISSFILLILDAVMTSKCSLREAIDKGAAQLKMIVNEDLILKTLQAVQVLINNKVILGSKTT